MFVSNLVRGVARVGEVERVWILRANLRNSLTFK